ncbi:MAG: hypothetical protein ACPHK1_02025 [Pseudohongiellaceae bacterium]
MPTTINDHKNAWLQTISVTLLGTVSLETGWPTQAITLRSGTSLLWR